ncbi:hypothetical protein Gotur_007833 [Gossypium turneri]
MVSTFRLKVLNGVKPHLLYFQTCMC